MFHRKMDKDASRGSVLEFGKAVRPVGDLTFEVMNCFECGRTLKSDGVAGHRKCFTEEFSQSPDGVSRCAKLRPCDL